MEFASFSCAGRTAKAVCTFWGFCIGFISSFEKLAAKTTNILDTRQPFVLFFAWEDNQRLHAGDL